ncbi:protein FAR1-RELATED SEQUENCE 5-like [Rhododendron vialii]|uniref:protein FAR1-RELATED SEQUENCE 5-like n=1 Tax=Rhododendron vialii TaxID=182163 RepID=UPI0026602346|nr:protein FAR1-RELATED SEQUENCE 5-like [Rhododendron vialii]
MQCLEEIDVFSPLASQPCESSASSPEVLYSPRVKKDLIPKIAQEFDNLDDVHIFYNKYAKESGFGMRLNSSKRNREGEIIRNEYSCCKTEPTLRRRGITGEGCGAKLSVVKRRSSEKFVVSQFVEGHNHPLTSPKRVHLLQSHRKVSVAKKAQQKNTEDPENVGFLQQDLYNAERERMKTLARHDANMLYEHFQFEQQKNAGFMFTMKKDDDGRMTHCFWADATSRKSYQSFGDVVVFDTTYNTNRYAMIFTPILGVNHHGQTTIFGCGFLSNERSDSFEWLFKEWLKAMPVGPPKMIITDYDLAMAKAIATTLPNTHHRYCIWHIVSKFLKK